MADGAATVVRWEEEGLDVSSFLGVMLLLRGMVATVGEGEAVEGEGGGGGPAGTTSSTSFGTAVDAEGSTTSMTASASPPPPPLLAAPAAVLCPPSTEWGSSDGVEGSGKEGSTATLGSSKEAGLVGGAEPVEVLLGPDEEEAEVNEVGEAEWGEAKKGSSWCGVATSTGVGTPTPPVEADGEGVGRERAGGGTSDAAVGEGRMESGGSVAEDSLEARQETVGVPPRVGADEAPLSDGLGGARETTAGVCGAEAAAFHPMGGSKVSEAVEVGDTPTVIVGGLDRYGEAMESGVMGGGTREEEGEGTTGMGTTTGGGSAALPTVEGESTVDVSLAVAFPDTIDGATLLDGRLASNGPSITSY